ncbi:DUF5765 domain-containing protein [Maritimibacter sp. HL-12]|uniref:DUF5765 domain-containing protein n=1 Tax=Maritimibacter sp. HL-12 TaxID=1162418 RepID=UPI000A0F15E4|nr:DUF5765 domain-containing protein [Maritimibacter sp. HL-12]SMH53717.1 hypothetical protein SAMN05661107_2828 [Maritimibacter sp. HL-12]
MCWSEGASLAMVGLGAAATFVTLRRGEPAAIPVTLAFFTVMEGLQAAGYLVIDECSLTSNKSITALSYLHIALQPIFINAFAMALVAREISPRLRAFVYAAAATASAVILLQLVPFDWAGPCQPGNVLCGPQWCTISGNWHLGWQVPLNDLWGALLGDGFARLVEFPTYLLAVFVLPLVYGAWRLVIFHALFGPALAWLLTDNPNEMPAIWCLFSVGLVVIALSPMIRRSVAPGVGVIPPADPSGIR